MADLAELVVETARRCSDGAMASTAAEVASSLHALDAAEASDSLAEVRMERATRLWHGVRNLRSQASALPDLERDAIAALWPALRRRLDTPAPVHPTAAAWPSAAAKARWLFFLAEEAPPTQETLAAIKAVRAADASERALIVCATASVKERALREERDRLVDEFHERVFEVRHAPAGEGGMARKAAGSLLSRIDRIDEQLDPRQAPERPDSLASQSERVASALGQVRSALDAIARALRGRKDGGRAD